MRKGPVANCKCSIGREQKIKATSDAKVHESLRNQYRARAGDREATFLS